MSSDSRTTEQQRGCTESATRPTISETTYEPPETVLLINTPVRLDVIKPDYRGGTSYGTPLLTLSRAVGRKFKPVRSNARSKGVVWGTPRSPVSNTPPYVRYRQ